MYFLKGENFFVNLVFLLVFPLVLAQAPQIEWEKNFGTNGLDDSFDVHQTTDDGFILAGAFGSTVFNTTGDNGNYNLIKLDNNGVLQWQTNIGGLGKEKAIAVEQTNDNGYIVVGYSYSNDINISNNGNSDVWVVKVDVNGVLQWQKNYGGSLSDVGWDIEQTMDNGFIIAGSTDSSDKDVSGNNGLGDYWIVKINNSGTLQWEKNYGGTSVDVARSIEQTNSGGYIVSGYSHSSDIDVVDNFGQRDFWIINLDSMGQMLWNKNYGGSSSEDPWSIRQTTNGGYVVAGYTQSNDYDVTLNKGGIDYWVLNLDAQGAIQWQKTYGGSLHDWAMDIQQTSDGGYVVTGASQSSSNDVSGNNGSIDYWVLKIDNIGNIEWEKPIGGSDEDWSYSISETKDGGFVLTGDSFSNDGDITGNNGYSDYWVVKLKGKSMWPRTYGDDGVTCCFIRRTFYDVEVDGDNNVYTSGWLNLNDVSYEDSNFQSQGSYFISKHDKDGNLIWIEYSNNYKFAQLGLYNNQIVAFNGEYLNGFDGNTGTNLFSYNIGDVVGGSLVINSTNGDIFLYSIFDTFFSNADYTINATAKQILGVFKFSVTGQYINHITSESPDVSSRFHDIEYVESTKKILLTGRNDNSTLTFTPNQSVSDTSFAVQYNDGTGGITFDSYVANGDDFGGIEYDNNNNLLYVQKNSKDVDLYNGDFSNYIGTVYTGSNIGIMEWFQHMSLNDNNGALYITSYGYSSSLGYNTSLLSKVNNNGLLWQVSEDPEFAVAAGGNNDEVFVGGHYGLSTTIGTYPLNSYPQERALFLTRIKENGQNPVFGKTSNLSNNVFKNELDENYVSYYPNPTTSNLYVATKYDEIIKHISIYAIDGRKVYERRGINKYFKVINLNHLKSGIYMIRINMLSGKNHIGKIVKN